MMQRKDVILDTLKKNKICLIITVCSLLINGAIFFFYDLNLEPFIYSEFLIFLILIVLLVFDYVKESRYAKERNKAISSNLFSDCQSISVSTLRDADYIEIIKALNQNLDEIQSDFLNKRQADDDYYTSWVHQIKTPISVIKMQLSEDNEQNRAILAELFRIEQYVEMVLDYIRLDSVSNDLVFKEYALDDIIRETLRKFASLFVLRKLKLNYESTDIKVITDKKWLSFIIEQIISNAIKYTPSGEISIKVSDNSIEILDTGIGIASEDIPLIFDKGYTGLNGRLGQKSSGLGLFLSQKAAKLISVKINVTSEIGKGSSFKISFNSNSW